MIAFRAQENENVNEDGGRGKKDEVIYPVE